MTGRFGIGLGLAIATATLLAGCEEGASPLGFLSGSGAQGDETAAPAARAATRTRLVERDVEAPQVFAAEEPGLWDGRPSLGGVWVAHPGAKDPERVIIRNPANGRFVIGALFRRERENPGPRLQVSSDAAAALGLVAGQPAALSVTALRREEVAEEAPDASAPILDTAELIETESIAAPAAPATPAARTPGTAAPAPTAAAPATAPAPATPAARPAAQATATAPATTGRNLLQIGIFSVEANANRAAEQVRGTGATVQVRREQTQGKDFWRVVAGPSTTAADRAALLQRVRALGYADAYFVSR